MRADDTASDSDGVGDDGRGSGSQRPGETEAERADRNFSDLLQELRVAQTGVQILFAFLLTLPLQARFTTLDRWDRAIVAADLMATAVATACLIAPVAYHRVLFRRRMKDEVVRAADRLAKCGLAALALGVVLSVLLALDLLLARPYAWAGSGAIAVLILVLWVVLPGLRRAEADAGGGASSPG